MFNVTSNASSSAYTNSAITGSSSIAKYLLTTVLIFLLWTSGPALVADLCPPNSADAMTSSFGDQLSSSFLNGGLRRLRHTTTTLSDGRILLIGGTPANVDDEEALRKSAQLFDPTSGTWANVGHHALVDRNHFTATLLEDGTVFVAGGVIGDDIGGQTQSSCMLFDPATPPEDSWKIVEHCLVGARGWHTATRLEDGRVLIAGGAIAGVRGSLPSLELCTAEGALENGEICQSVGQLLSIGRSGHTATRLLDGRVWISGGIEEEDQASVDIFVPASSTTPTDAVIAGPTSLIPRYDHATIALRNGQVVSVGGAETATSLESWDGQDLVGLNVQSTDLECSFPRPAATLLPDDSILLFGGEKDSSSKCVMRCQLEADSLPSCERIGALRDARPLLNASLLAGGRVLLTGAGQCTRTSGSIYFVNRSTPLGVVTPFTMSVGRAGHTSTLLANGDLLVAGGTASEIYRYASPEAGWTDFRQFRAPQTHHRAVHLQDKRVLLIGGSGPDGLTSTTQVYCPRDVCSADGWSEGPPMSCPRQRHTATRLWDGRILVVGGDGECVERGTSASQTYELFDPRTSQWSPLKDLPTAIGPRKGHSATLLEDGRVMLAGGDAEHGFDSTKVGFFDPMQEFTSTGPWASWHEKLLVGRSNQSATLLSDGSVLILGGGFDATQNRGEILHLEDQCLRSCSQPAQGPGTIAGEQALVLMPDGRVLAIGGRTNASAASFNNFIFEPVTRLHANPDGFLGQWFGVAGSSVAHLEHAATLLPNQEVMISGGRSDSSPMGDMVIAVSERFDLDLRFEESSKPSIETLAALDIGTPFDLKHPENHLAAIPADAHLRLGQRLLIQGRAFLGVSEGSGGQGMKNSPSDSPIVQLRSLNNEQVRIVPVAEVSKDILLTDAVTDFPPGPTLVTVFVNGVPSLAQPLEIVHEVEFGVTTENNAAFTVASTGSPALQHTFIVTNSSQAHATDVDVELEVETTNGPLSSIGITVNGEGFSTPLAVSAEGRILWRPGTILADSQKQVQIRFDLCPPSSTNPGEELCATDLTAVKSRLTGLRSRQPMAPTDLPVEIATTILPTNQTVDLRASVSDFRSQVAPEETLQTEYTVENSGSNVAFDALVTSEALAAQPSEPACTGTLETIYCSGTSASSFPLCLVLPPGASCTWILETTVDEAPGFIFEHQLEVSDRSRYPGGWVDEHPENNKARDTTLVLVYPEQPVSPGGFPAAAAAENKFLVVFANGDSIQASQLETNGTSVSPEPFDIGTGNHPDVSFEIDFGKYWVVWEGSDGCLKLAKVFDPHHPENTVTLVDTGIYPRCARGRAPAIASGRSVNVDPNGDLLPKDSTTWVAYQVASGNRTRIILARGPGYPPTDPSFPRGTTDDFTQDMAPRLAVKNNELVALVWTRVGQGIFAQVFDPDPRLAEDSPIVYPEPFRLDKGDAAGEEPDIAYDAVTDHFYAVWRKPSGKIQARALSATSPPTLGSIFGVNSPPLDGGSQSQPRIDCFNARCSVAWQRKKSGNGPGESIIAQVFSTQGTRLGDELQIDTDEDSSNERQPAIVFAPDNDPALDRFLVAWAADDAGKNQVHARVIPLNALRLKTPVDGVLAPLRRIYEVTVDWTEPIGQESPVARRIAVQPDGIDSAGYFWFYELENIEVMVKLLEIEGEAWISYASLTERPIELKVRDCGFDGDCAGSIPVTIPSQPQSQCGGLITSTQIAEESVLEKGDGGVRCPLEGRSHQLFGRFDIRVCWRDPQGLGGPYSAAQPLGGVLDSTLRMGPPPPFGTQVGSAVFTFNLTSQLNPEVAVKIVDTHEGDFAVFYGGATNLEYQIEFVDTETCDAGSDCPPALTLHHPAGDYCGGNAFELVP